MKEWGLQTVGHANAASQSRPLNTSSTHEEEEATYKYSNDWHDVYTHMAIT